MPRELVALARPAARPVPSLEAWPLGCLTAWVGPSDQAPETLAARAVALGHAHVRTPVLPFRAGASVSDPDALRRALGDLGMWRDRLDVAARWLELGVHWPRPALPSVPTAGGPGGAWLAQRRQDHADDLVSARAVDQLGRVLDNVEYRARALALDELVVRIAVLVSPADAPTVRERVGALASAVTGPWAPSSFAPALSAPA